MGEVWKDSQQMHKRPSWKKMSIDYNNISTSYVGENESWL